MNANKRLNQTATMSFFNSTNAREKMRMSTLSKNIVGCPDLKYSFRSNKIVQNIL